MLVVGAGRGPLVEATLNAAKTTSKQLRVYVVEKNSNAIVTLNSLHRDRWSNLDYAEVEVFCCDMRDFVSEHKADLVISELLGSFSDNELSPECLDGVYKSVKPKAISIPQSYTSYMQPLMSHRLHSEVLLQRPLCPDKAHYFPFELNYVCYIRNAFLVDQPKAVFHFDHLNLHKHPSERNNSRFKELSFESTLDYLCHGFSGYFDCTLYRNITLSTVPGKQTPGMFSWFPIYFPIIEPVFVRAGELITFNVWRLSDNANVWYEWCTSSPKPSFVHNIKGRSLAIGLH